MDVAAYCAAQNDRPDNLKTDKRYNAHSLEQQQILQLERDAVRISPVKQKLITQDVAVCFALACSVTNQSKPGQLGGSFVIDRSEIYPRGPRYHSPDLQIAGIAPCIMTWRCTGSTLKLLAAPHRQPDQYLCQRPGTPLLIQDRPDHRSAHSQCATNFDLE